MKRMLSLCLGVALLLTGGLSHADSMDGISAASPLAHGESVSTAAAKVMEPLPMEELLALMPESRGFLGEGDLPHGMTFTRGCSSFPGRSRMRPSSLSGWK